MLRRHVASLPSAPYRQPPSSTSRSDRPRHPAAAAVSARIRTPSARPINSPPPLPPAPRALLSFRTVETHRAHALGLGGGFRVVDLRDGAGQDDLSRVVVVGDRGAARDRDRTGDVDVGSEREHGAFVRLRRVPHRFSTFARHREEVGGAERAQQPLR